MLDPEPVRLSVKLKLRAESEVFRIVVPSAVVVVKPGHGEVGPRDRALGVSDAGREGAAESVSALRAHIDCNAVVDVGWPLAK